MLQLRDKNLYVLFPLFPREYSIFRETISSMEEFERRILADNGVSDIFVSVYDTGCCVIDKAVFDIDNSSNLNKSLEEARILCRRLEDAGVSTIPVFSGKKGFHVYALLSPCTLERRLAKHALSKFVEKFAGDLGLIDSHLVGNVSALIRVPNTIHPTGYGYCTYLRHDELTDLRSIASLVKGRRFIEYDVSRVPLEDYVEISEISVRISEFPSISGSHTLSRGMLGHLLRPCVLEEALKEAPGHMVRVELVSELMFLGYSEADIVSLCGKLGWKDYSEKITEVQVRQIFKRFYKPLSCKNLKYYVECRNCAWRYFWND